VLDSFDTRHANVAAVFLDQLEAICKRTWSEKYQDWQPDDLELAALLSIVSSCRPKNEAQAAMAAQMAAVHLLTMRVADKIGEHPWDMRMVGAFAKLTRTYAEQMDIMNTLHGKSRSTRQKIIVRHEKHVHHHQHVHVKGGAKENGSQAHASTDVAGECAALPGDNARGEVVPFTSGDGQGRVPNARRLKGVGSAGR
jgi:hypothetical protein